LKDYEGVTEFGSTVVASGPGRSAGFLLRRRDQEYAARAQIPENM
jgi:hypothetical protein